MTASTRVRNAWKTWRSATLEIGAVRPLTVARPSAVATMFTATYGRSAGAIVARHDLGDHEGCLLAPFEARHVPGELLYFQDVKDIEPGHEA